MIKFENTNVFNLDGAVRGMRNPLNSWAMSDSFYSDTGKFYIGEKDLNLMERLISAGSSHRKFLRQMLLCVDITAPLYWWKEFDTYKVATVSNSCSTMHKIQAKEFTLDDFSYEHLMLDSEEHFDYLHTLSDTIVALNRARDRFNETKDKNYWWQMIQLLPTSYNQKRTITMDYETLLNIYETRKGHKLDEWNDFRRWIDELPYAKELFNLEKKDGQE